MLLSKLSIACFLAGSCNASSTRTDLNAGLFPRTASFEKETSLQHAELRILPLGDSITYGTGSTNGNGYRADLLSRFDNAYNIGSVRSGTMKNNQNEGHSGALISQITDYSHLSLPEQPNVVLLHAGTNDMVFVIDPDDAPSRLANLINTINATCPDALIIVAQIIGNANESTQALIDTYNAAIPGTVADRRDAGIKVVVVDMSNLLDTSELVVNGTHPDDAGYQKMANAWYDALSKQFSAGNVSTPVQPFVKYSLGTRASPSMLALGTVTMLIAALLF